MKKLAEIKLKDQKVLIRVDFNVPLLDGVVANDFRIRAALPTIKHCLVQGASVVLMSHLGRPKGKAVPEMSLEPVAEVLEEYLGCTVHFSDDCISEDAVEFSKSLKPGEVHLLENLRFHTGETKNIPEFAKKLAQHGSVYINDAFGTAHRAHASNVGVLEYMPVAAAGKLLEKERTYLSDAIRNPEKPLAVLLGGAKVSGKIELIKNLMNTADSILVGGAMAYTFLKVQGKKVGGSRIDDENLDVAEELLQLSKQKGVNIELPSDVVAAPEISDDAPFRVIDLEEFEDDEMGLDIGPETAMRFGAILSDAKTILWNGPVGVFELTNFATGTQAIISAIQATTEMGAVSIVGGGDTAAAIEDFNGQEGFTHISTGGGASLELLSGAYLPAFKVLDENE